MSQLTNTVITLEDFVDNVYPIRADQARFMADNARTNILMFKATKDIKYLSRAKQDIEKGKDILRGFSRPLGVLFTES
jgi:hypothetical protein